jgi:hypothetical protein
MSVAQIGLKVYLCSPYNGGDNTDLPCLYTSLAHQRRHRNRRYAFGLMLRIMREKRAAVFAPHLLYTSVLDEDKAVERKLGLDAGMKFLEACDLLVIGDKYGVSEGMKLEIEYAHTLGIPVVKENDYLNAGRTIR